MASFVLVFIFEIVNKTIGIIFCPKLILGPFIGVLYFLNFRGLSEFVFDISIIFGIGMATFWGFVFCQKVYFPLEVGLSPLYLKNKLKTTLGIFSLFLVLES